MADLSLSVEDKKETPEVETSASLELKKEEEQRDIQGSLTGILKKKKRVTKEVCIFRKFSRVVEIAKIVLNYRK